MLAQVIAEENQHIESSGLQEVALDSSMHIADGQRFANLQFGRIDIVELYAGLRGACPTLME